MEIIANTDHFANYNFFGISTNVSALVFCPMSHLIFKICTITYQALSCKQSSYLNSLVTPVRKHVQLIYDYNINYVYFRENLHLYAYNTVKTIKKYNTPNTSKTIMRYK